MLLLAGCGETSPTKSHGPDPTVASPRSTATTPSRTPDADAAPHVIDTIATGLDTPWGIAFLPDGSALVAERDTARILHVVGHQVTEVGRLDQAVANGESGLLGLAVSPSYDKDHRVFAYLTTESDNRIVSMTYTGRRIGKPRTLLTGIPQGFIHDGGRLAFGPDGYLYASTGEGGQPDRAQDPDSLGGKILRITTDGDPAPGNPDPDSPVWTMGHRNVQGLAFDDNGHLWASEFGDSAWDELNLITRGTNYGWPQVEGKGDLDQFRNPLIVWRTEDASPSGLAWTHGHLWLASLRGERLWRVDVSGTRASSPTDFFVGRYGRLRTVVTAPDGNLWVTTSNKDGRGDPKDGDDRILVISPGG